MAGWALGLAIVPCCGGITTLVGIGLAITVLVKSRHGRDHGKALAISALVIGALWLVAGVVAVALGAFNDLTQDAERDSSGEVVSRDEMAPAKLRAGDCFDYPDLFGSSAADPEVEAATVTAVPCLQAHQFEVYKTFEIPGDHFPGKDRVQRIAAEGCLPAFRAFVGRPYGRSQLEPYVLYPQSNSWRLLDDRGVTCIVGNPHELTTGSLKQSRL